MTWLLGVLINVLIAWVNNLLRLKAIEQKKPIAIRHGLWGAFYCGLCMIPFIWDRNWFEVASLLLLHISVFWVSYNWIVDRERSPFRISTTSTAITEMAMVKLGLKSAEVPVIVGFALSVGLELYYLIKF